MKLYQLLIESRVDFLKEKYSILLKNKFYSKDQNIDAEYVQFYFETQFKRIIETDPTTNKIYLQWLLNNLLKLDFEDYFIFIGEDYYKWREYLTIYHKVKNKLPLEQRDINKLSLEELKDIALQYKEKEDEVGTKNEVLDKKYKINENENYLVYMFKTATQDDFKMYQLVSTNTEWCTRPRYNTFKEYIDKSPLFIFINKQNRIDKYQFHEESSQFMDKDDKEILDTNTIQNFLKLIKKYRTADFILFELGWWDENHKTNYVIFDKDGNIVLNNLYYASFIQLSTNQYTHTPKSHPYIIELVLAYKESVLYNLKTKKILTKEKYMGININLIMDKYLIATRKGNGIIYDLIDIEGNVILDDLSIIKTTSDRTQPFILVQKNKEKEKYIVNLKDMTKLGPFAQGDVRSSDHYTFILKPTENSAKYEFTPYFKNNLRLISLDGDTSPEILNNLKTTKI